MKKKLLRERIKREIEAEAAALEKKVEGKEEISPPDDLYAKILGEAEASSPKDRKIIRIFKKPLLAVAVIVVLGVAASVGVSGAKLFVPRVENRGGGDRVNISVNNDDADYVEVTEEEAYDEIEEKLGILALRLQYRPQNMELKKAYIDEVTGEALLEFYYEEQILTIYENRKYDASSINVQFDGKIIKKFEHFHLEKELEIMEVDKNSEDTFYHVQLEYGNAYYDLLSDMELQEFEKILQGTYFKNV